MPSLLSEREGKIQKTTTSTVMTQAILTMKRPNLRIPVKQERLWPIHLCLVTSDFPPPSFASDESWGALVSQTAQMLRIRQTSDAPTCRERYQLHRHLYPEERLQGLKRVETCFGHQVSPWLSLPYGQRYRHCAVFPEGYRERTYLRSPRTLRHPKPSDDWLCSLRQLVSASPATCAPLQQ